MSRRIIEKTFAASAFAEAGEHETAMQMAGIKPAYEKVSRVFRFIERNFAAAGFAEAGCRDDAIRWAHQAPAAAPRRDPLDVFLETVGLDNVRVCYGLVRA